jgi:hypothetical protein
MGALMDLVAGNSREILLAVAVEDWQGLADRDRFDAHLSLGGGLDPTWLDLFSEAVRAVTGGEEPRDFLDARTELDGLEEAGERTIERVDSAWVTAIARLGDHDVDAVAGRWIDLLEQEIGQLPREEKPWIRSMAGDLVQFARAADSSPAVLFAWSL